MKIFIISPNVGELFTKTQKEELTRAGDVTFISDVQPLKEVAELYQGTEPRIVAVDPDFSDWSFPNDVMDTIPNLKAICLQTTGFHWVDVEHAKEKGIVVTQLKGFSSIAVAEWATFMALAVARKLPIVIADNWQLDYGKHRGFELRGKTAGVVGIGNIGTAIAENMAGLGMNVQYWSRKSRDERFSYVELAKLVRTSDVLLFAVAPSEETRSLVTVAMLDTLKSTAVVVSIAEPIFDHEHLTELVRSGKVGGYAYEDEKGPFGKNGSNIWNGPALGWCTNESMQKNAEQWVESIVKAAQGNYPTRVN